MNKKIFALSLVLLFAILLSSCLGKSDNKFITNNNGYSDEMYIEKITSNDDIDIDLTILSSTMVYSEVYNMLYNPDNYIGKIIKMEGTYTEYVNNANDIVYPALIIADATMCCTQGMEFVLKDGIEYPNIDENLTVVGRFETYMEDGCLYCHLVNCEIV